MMDEIQILSELVKMDTTDDPWGVIKYRRKY